MRTCTYFYMVLDIETSTYKNKIGEPVATWLSYGYNCLYRLDGKCIDRCYFRNWEELKNYYVYISNRFLNYKILCYVHNLGYEMEYIMKNISKPKKFLTNSTHQFISATLEEFPSIEFRCSAKLSAKKLEDLGKELGFKKLHSDYRQILPRDEVTEKEKKYCIRDCDIVAKYVSDDLIKEFHQLSKIPYTKTGRVRLTYTNFYLQYVKEFGEPIWDLYPPENCYDALTNAFSGGITISNPIYTALPLKNVHSYDISSSYPFAQLSEEYPYTIEKVENPTIDMLNERFWIAKIKFNNISSKFAWQWMSISKLNEFDCLSEFFNGKLIKSDFVVRTITNVDFDIINMTYTYDDIEVLEFYRMSKWGKLPKPYIDTILFYADGKYNAKQELKKFEEEYGESHKDYLAKVIEYTKVKNDFNSIYGMTVQKIVQDEYEIDDDYVWKKIKKPYKQLKKHMKRNFLFGIYTTAYARYNLVKAIVTNCPYTFVYADTDSIKFIGDNRFIDTNKKIPTEYENIKSVSSLGRFEYEGTYDEFLTYGAKKYGYIKENTLHLTVAGLPKSGKDCKFKIYHNNKEIKNFYNRIENFKLGCIFKDCKLGKKYIVNNKYFELNDCYEAVNEKNHDEETLKFLHDNGIVTGGGVALFECSYTLSMTPLDKFIVKEKHDFLKSYIKGLKENYSIDLTENITKKSMITEE